MAQITRPTGIIRTLPSFPPANEGYQARLRFEASVAALERGDIPAIYIALAQKPTIEVLHLYLLIEGQIEVRFNLAGYEPGDARRCWDGQTRAPKYWAVCTGPVSRPEEPIKRRGFQGFRYTEGLW